MNFSWTFLTVRKKHRNYCICNGHPTQLVKSKLILSVWQGVHHDIVLGDAGVGEDEEALHDVAQLTDVAAPGVVTELLDGIGVYLLDRLAGLLADLPDEMLYEHRDVLPPLGQRGNAYDDNADTVVEVLAEVALLYLLLQVLVRGGHYPYVDCYVLVAADLGQFVLLQHAEDLGLGRKGHIAYLIEKESAAVRLLELALVLLLRPGESPLLVTEELALYQLARNSRAVDLDERHGRTVALFMQPPGHQFLTRTVGACNEHPGIGRGHAVDHILDADDGR